MESEEGILRGDEQSARLVEAQEGAVVAGAEILAAAIENGDAANGVGNGDAKDGDLVEAEFAGRGRGDDQALGDEVARAAEVVDGVELVGAGRVGVGDAVFVVLAGGCAERLTGVAMAAERDGEFVLRKTAGEVRCCIGEGSESAIVEIGVDAAVGQRRRQGRQERGDENRHEAGHRTKNQNRTSWGCRGEARQCTLDAVAGG